jgi:uncharacterized protein YecE (DUF72 family)
MARLLVGQPALRGDLGKYSSRFDMVELRPVDTSLPRPGALRKWRASTPPTFVFSIVLPRDVGSLEPGEALDKALETSLGVARTLEARCIVLQTPASIRPTASNKKRLAAVWSRVPKEGVVRCWEPLGMWEREDILATARELGVVPVLDVASEAPPSGSVVYTRLRALGKTSAMSAATMEKIADRLRSRREVFVVVERASEATRVRTALTEALARKQVQRAAPVVIRPASSPQLVADDEEQ